MVVGDDMWFLVSLSALRYEMVEERKIVDEGARFRNSLIAVQGGDIQVWFLPNRFAMRYVMLKKTKIVDYCALSRDLMSAVILIPGLGVSSGYRC